MRPAKRVTSPLRAGPIHGDELEHNRIQLEHNLQHTDLSLHLSSQPDSEQESEPHQNYESSVEYPRHNSGPEPFAVNAFASFDGEDFGGNMDSHSHIHAWSYRTADDDDAVNPYGGESMSTAAHHASALTLSAGLRGHGRQRDISLSGAEYDPERPLGDIIAGVDSRFTMLDVEPSKSRYQNASAVTFDPLVVDDTAELERVLRSGHATAASSLAARLRPTTDSSSGSDSDSSSRSNRPKLSNALHCVASFSPKRPRSAQSQLGQSYHKPTRGAGPSTSVHQPSQCSPPRANFEASHENENDIPTPKPRSKRTHAQVHPEVTVQPPTPSTGGSRFTKMARGLARDIEAEQRSLWSEAIRGSAGKEEDVLAHSTVHQRRGKHRSGAVDRNPFSDIGNAIGVSTISNVGTRKGTPRAPKVHLPDVTGLTSAVASPAKIGLDHYEYEGGEAPREAEARFLSVLSAVQSKLVHLESENSVSRRRVRELEHELEACKAEVARERTKIMEQDSLIGQQQHEDAQRISRKEKGKGKCTRFENDEELEARYREVVEEKKALEALVATLRKHLTRLTSELTSHQQLLSELRELRDSDAKTLREKSAEVERLREEVERLAGEVEVLKGVVEEGLNERKAVREASARVEEQVELLVAETQEQEQSEDEEEQSPLLTRQANMDRTMRTDHATLGSSNPSGTLPRPFIDREELDRISLELEERRSDRSGGSLSRSHGEVSDIHNVFVRDDRAPSPSMAPPSMASPSVKSTSMASQVPHTSSDDSPLPREPDASRPHEATSRPAAPTPAHASQRPSHRRSRHGPNQKPLSTPFPQIRGGQLEQLFFSAPEHNTNTCNVCHRRNRRSEFSSWIPRRSRNVRARVEEVDEEDDDDEGFVEGPEAPRGPKGKGNPSNDREREGLPPQTVLARVLRELEDDFTHYKSIYVELAEQYGLMDAASNVSKRNVLAEHLREVIDILEQKGDQIASLYDLLTFKDKPISESVVSEIRRTHSTPVAETSSWGRDRGIKRHPTFA